MCVKLLYGLTIPKSAMVFFCFLRKGPHCTKYTTTTQNVVNYYAVVFLLRPPKPLRLETFLKKKKCRPHRRGRDSNHCAIVNSPRVVDLLCVVFLVLLGPLGWGHRRGS